VAFAPYITVAMVVPVAVDPASVGVGWGDIGTGDPDVAVSVVTVIAGMPSPVGMLVGWRRNTLHGARRRTDTDYDLGLCDACGKKECAGGNGEDFLHLAGLLDKYN
jgi:hypothetical protein